MKILLSGATGKIGREIERLVRDDDTLEISGRASSQAFFTNGNAGDVLVDFSRPELTLQSLSFAVERGIPMLIGTTGLDADARAAIDDGARRIAICQAANFSVGVNLLLDLVARAAGGLPDSFDVEITEAHHRWKVDAPSGTALALGRAVAGARGQDTAGAIRGDGGREPGEIGYQVVRGGDVAGEHAVLFLGDGERLEFTHRATDRAIFARGALHAARRLIGRPSGLYSMREIIEQRRDVSASA